MWAHMWARGVNWVTPAAPWTVFDNVFRVDSVQFSPDSKTLASGGFDGTIRLWDLRDPGAQPTVLPGHELRVIRVRFSPDGERLASASADTSVRLWDMDDPNAPPTLLYGHEGIVFGLAFHPVSELQSRCRDEHRMATGASRSGDGDGRGAGRADTGGGGRQGPEPHHHTRRVQTLDVRRCAGGVYRLREEGARLLPRLRRVPAVIG